jgi:uncharacterized protein YbdZ (MbtH family)
MLEAYHDWQEEPERVVKSYDGKYEVWPMSMMNPAGWEDAGFTGTRSECLAYIEGHGEGLPQG